MLSNWGTLGELYQNSISALILDPTIRSWSLRSLWNRTKKLGTDDARIDVQYSNDLANWSSFEDDWVTVNPSDVAGAEADANEGPIENEEAEGEPEDEPEEEIIVNGKIIIKFLNPGYLTA